MHTHDCLHRSFIGFVVTLMTCVLANGATITLSGTVTEDGAGTPMPGVQVGASRVAQLGSGNPSDPIPVVATTNTDASGVYTISVDDATPDLDRVLVFTRGGGYDNKLYDNVPFSGSSPTYADVAAAGVVEVDFTHNVTGIDFSLVSLKTTHMIAMSDGTRLATDVYLPNDTGPWPVILYRTVYGKNNDHPDTSYLDQGYAIVAQDMRGCSDSEDIFRAYYDDGWGDNKDGYETVLWVRSQPWCNGKIGTLGGSARGLSQNFLAGSVPPGLLCQDIGVAASDLYSQAMFQGGGFRKALTENWMDGRGPGARPYLEDEIKTRPHYDDVFWPHFNCETRHHLIDWPIVNRGGWYDIFLQGTINNFVSIQANGGPNARGKQKLIIEPYGHGKGDGGFRWPDGCESAPVAYASTSAWLGHWLTGTDTGVMDDPCVAYDVLGDVDEPGGPGNEWRTANGWPVPATEVPFYFHEGGSLDTVPPTTNEASDVFVYDPNDPVPTIGGANLTITNGPYDQRPVESRSDVVVFTTAPLEGHVEITGKVLVQLFASSSALDTDFTGKLCDVYPNGRSMLVCDGIIRARHRNTQRYDELLTPGVVYEFEVDLWETCIVFNAGHRIRVAISSSNYPRFEINPNTGEFFNQHTQLLSTNNTIYHDVDHPSHILFRVTGPDANGDGVPDPADLDGDGLPDTFERLIIDADDGDAITTLEDVLPGDDFDGDSYSNHDEWRNNTDPTTPDAPASLPGPLAALVISGLLVPVA